MKLSVDMLLFMLLHNTEGIFLFEILNLINSCAFATISITDKGGSWCLIIVIMNKVVTSCSGVSDSIAVLHHVLVCSFAHSLLFVEILSSKHARKISPVNMSLWSRIPGFWYKVNFLLTISSCSKCEVRNRRTSLECLIRGIYYYINIKVSVKVVTPWTR
jgi:hypothetical protein